MNGRRTPAYTRSAPLRNASSTSACPMPRLPPVTRTDLPVIVVPFISSSFGLIRSSAISIALCDNRDPLGRQNPSRGLETVERTPARPASLPSGIRDGDQVHAAGVAKSTARFARLRDRSPVNGITLALAASLAWGCSDFLAGVQSRRGQVFGLLVFSRTTGFALMLPLAIASGEPLPAGGAVAGAAAAGVFGLVGLGCFYRAMAIGDVGLVAPISGTASVVPLAVDVVAGHRPGPIAALGLVLALVGIGVASWERGGERAASRAGECTALAIVAALGLGVFFVGMDAAADAGVWWPVVIARLASLSALLVVALVTRRSASVA